MRGTIERGSIARGSVMRGDEDVRQHMRGPLEDCAAARKNTRQHEDDETMRPRARHYGRYGHVKLSTIDYAWQYALRKTRESRGATVSTVRGTIADSDINGSAMNETTLGAANNKKR